MGIIIYGYLLFYCVHYDVDTYRLQVRLVN